MVMIKQQLLMVGKMQPLLMKLSEYRFMRPDGKLRVMGQSIPELNSENQIVGWYRYRYYRA
jgi:hypothetical protein